MTLGVRLHASHSGVVIKCRFVTADERLANVEPGD